MEFKELEKTHVDCEISLSAKEEEILLKYFEDNHSPEDLKNLKIEWAVIKMLEGFIKTTEKEKDEE